MITINAQTVAVESEADLRTAVSSNNGIDYVYLAVDITLTSGITIYAGAGKPSLTIDGLHDGITHTFTDMNSRSIFDTIGVNTASSMALTFKNMIITGRNFYGVPYIYELPNTNNLSVTYENVTYSGPQLAYNFNGLTRFIDCDITIQQNGVAEAQEVGEVNRVEMDGTVRIHHNTNVDHAVFYFHGSANTAAFTVLTDADVTVTTVYNYFMYNVVPLFFTPIPVRYTIEPGASFTLNANKGISYEVNHQIASLLVDTNASFRYVQTSSNGTTPAFFINGELKVNQGASFYMQAYENTAPLVWFTTSAARLTLNDPKSFVVYSRNTDALYFTSSTPFSLTGGQLNYWSTAMTPWESAGKFDDVPQRKWFKKDYAIPLELSGTVTQVETTVGQNNLMPEDLPLPPLSDLHLHDAKVLSLGNLLLAVNPVVNDRTPITGTTTPNANVKVEYTIEGVSHSFTVTADSEGKFTVPTPEAIPVNTSVTISANIPFLIRELSTDSQEAGELFIESAPTLIRFVLPPISLDPLLLGRATPVAPVKVVDSRVYSTQWELMASTDGPMQTQSGHILPNAVVFADGSSMVPLRVGDPIPVFEGGPDASETTVIWNDDKGILLNVTVPLHNKQEYTARLTWGVRPV